MPRVQTQYEQATAQITSSADELLSKASQTLQNCRERIEKYKNMVGGGGSGAALISKFKVEDFKSLFKVAVSNGVQISLLQKNMKKQTNVNFQFQMNLNYPIISL
eukprot:TRINITY_DN3571_c5_g2_i1.p1 TRINITY_DN3571_c5_g2~~TRINITY_DN3571_c5_g2_i1.p1  ORF type:complete len:116 (-),score=18.65 TRINITY_DN3571_c5_g2_i1:55-369(-)